MKNFLINLEIMGRSGNEEEGFTLEVDDIVQLESSEEKFNTIQEAIKWAVEEYPELEATVGECDEVDESHCRIVAGNSSELYTKYNDAPNLSSDSVGMAYVEIQEFRYESDDRFAKKLFFHDGEWV